ncbi:MAG: low temperature-induced protein [Tissierella sp.]|nr:low temperature-induced protein [Tissierella sp.]
MAKKVVGIFRTQAETINAIERLKKDGYYDNEISVVAKHQEDLDVLRDLTDVDVDTTDVSGGAATGAMVGGTIGGIGAILIEIGVIAIPGVGPFLAAGPIAAALTGAIAGGALGGVVGALVDLGIPEEEAVGYEEFIDLGYILVLVDQYEGRDVYGNFYENNSVIRDRYNYDHVNTHYYDDPNRKL